MAVAKSYENMEQIGEPFNQNGKLYVKMRGNCTRCGGSGHYSYNQMDGTRCYGCNGTGKATIAVRWYTDAQRAAMDRAAEKRQALKEKKVEERRIKFAARNAFGFGEQGFITLFKGDQKIINDWAHETDPCRARYNTLFGWFCPSKLAVENLPDTVTAIRLDWDTVRDPADEENLQMLDDTTVINILKDIKGETSPSTYQGTKNEWLEREVKIKRNIPLSGPYGNSNMHIMEDADGNVYVWTTASKSIEEGTSLNMRMKVKDHQEYNSVEQTIVYYCKVK